MRLNLPAVLPENKEYAAVIIGDGMFWDVRKDGRLVFGPSQAHSLSEIRRAVFEFGVDTVLVFINDDNGRVRDELLELAAEMQKLGWFVSM